MSGTFRILPGLPPYGSLPVQFTATGRGTHREGLVVEFSPRDSPTWVGNFQRGWSGYSDVWQFIDGVSALVVASGQGYWIHLTQRCLLTTFGVDIHAMSHASSDEEVVVFNDYHGLYAWDSSGSRWHIDMPMGFEIEEVESDGRSLLVKLFDIGDECSHLISVNVRTGTLNPF